LSPAPAPAEAYRVLAEELRLDPVRLEGCFGDHHRTDRTAGSELFINPLMAFYWCFRLAAVARRILYLDGIRPLSTYFEVQHHIELFHAGLRQTHRPWRDLPM
jgi:hypothetical protein